MRETFHAVYYFLLFLAWVKKILPIFHFTMLAGLPKWTGVPLARATYVSFYL